MGVVKEAGRTCIIAASKEAKKLGIKTGTSAGEASQLCPNIILLPAAFEHYLAATQQLQRIFQQVCPNVIIYSLDEAFLDISDCRRWLYPSAVEVGEQVQAHIKQALGEWVTCNVGIGPNRFLAKLVSEVSPKGTVRQVHSAELDGLLASVQFADVCGIGPRLARKLARWNVSNLIQLRLYSVAELTKLVGPFWAQELKKMAWGEEPHLLQLLDKPLLHQQCVGRSTTLRKLATEQAEIERVLVNLTEEVTYKTRAMGLVGRRIGVTLVGSQQHWHAQQLYQEPIRHTADMFGKIKYALLPRWQQRFPVIKLAVTLSHTKPLTHSPTPLWATWHQQEKLALASDSVNSRFGLFTIHPASLLHTTILRPEVTGFLGDGRYWGLNP